MEMFNLQQDNIICFDPYMNVCKHCLLSTFMPPVKKITGIQLGGIQTKPNKIRNMKMLNFHRG